MNSGNQPRPPPAGSSKPQSTEYELKKYLLLLATLVATVTYAAGLNLPGGSWLADSPAEGRLAGDSILRETNYTRYIVFYYFNAISFAASLLAGLLLLILHQDGEDSWGGWLLLQLVRLMMLVDLLGLMGAYGVGSSHDGFTTACAAYLLASGVAAFAFIALPLLAYAITLRRRGQQDLPADGGGNGDDEQLETMLVLAIFAATVAYVAGLNPPGGFWRSSEEGHHAAGDPVLQDLHPRRYRAFFFLNTAAFVASLLAIMLVVSYDKLRQGLLRRRIPASVRKAALYGPIVVALLGLGGAYAFGSCRDSRHTAYVVVLLVALAAASILLQVAAQQLTSFGDRIKNLFKKCHKLSRLDCCGGTASSAEGNSRTVVQVQLLLEKTREDIQLLAILAATIAYQAGVDPPGGVWAESGEGHIVGDPILLTTHPVRYKVFFYSNSAALVASLVIMVMLQSERLVRGHALEATMILDLFGLIGAYAAGSARDTSTSIYTVAMAGAVLIYVVIHIVFFTLDSTPTPEAGTGSSAPPPAPDSREIIGEEEDRLQKRRDVLLLLSVLGATLTYQAGLTPPGGFWEEDDNKSGHRAGFPVLLDKYPLRYKIFYYFNAASFMASVALIVLLFNQNLYKPGIQCYALYVCMVAGMFGLMGAYSAGSSLHLRTSIIVLALVSALTVVSFTLAIYVRCVRSTSNGGKAKKKKEEAKKKEDEDMMYLMLVGILGASVTYLTGLKPPGGMWREDGNGHSAAGYPILYDTNKPRYNAFFYSNSTSFMASVVIIASLLSRMILPEVKRHRIHLWPMHTAMVLDMLTLLGAYAAGSARKWGTSTKVVLLLVPILLLIWGVLFLCNRCQERKGGGPNPSNTKSEP